MDNRKVVEWISAAVGRGIAWLLAAKLGMEAVESGELGTAIAGALASLVIAGASIYSSVKGRRKLLSAEPPAR